MEQREHLQRHAFRDCLSSNGEPFIVEGDSAAGSLIQSRDPKIRDISIKRENSKCNEYKRYS